MKRRTRLEPGAQPTDPPASVELSTVDADAFDSDLMITSKATRRPKRFEFGIENGVALHNDGFSDHFPIVTTVETIGP